MLVLVFSFHQRFGLSISPEHVWEQSLHELRVMFQAMSLGICMDPDRHVTVKMFESDIYTQHHPLPLPTRSRLLHCCNAPFHCFSSEAFTPLRHQNYHSLVTSRLLINIDSSFSSLFYWKNLQRLTTSSLKNTLASIGLQDISPSLFS